MLASLGSDYDTLVTSICTRTDPMTITDLYAHMVSYGAIQIKDAFCERCLAEQQQQPRTWW